MAMTQNASQYFQKTAESWDNLRSGYFGDAVRDAAIAKAYLRPEMVVADVGAGTGFMAAGLAPLVRRVYVVDGSAAMLEVAKKNLSRFSNVEYREADGLELPFPEESLDAVFANMYLHHCADPLAAIREMVRVLQPGGRLVITDMDEHTYAWLKEEMADVWQGFGRAQVRAWFQEAGLVNGIVDCTGESCCATSSNPTIRDDQGRQAEISVFVATGTRRMEMRSMVRDAYAAHAEESSCCSSSTDKTTCCGGAEITDEVTYISEYSAEELAAAPQEAASFSLGCGNPIAMSNLKPGETVVDIGSGGGLDSFLAAGKVGPGGRVIGVDMTPAMLERARAAAQRSGIQNVEFREGYAEALPVGGNMVDVVLSNCVINLTEDKGLAFREAFRVLKPGGRLEISDMVLGGPIPIEARENAFGWAECVSGALPEREYLDLVTQAGFTEITTRRSPSGGDVVGVPVYSLIVSARKPGGDALPESPAAASTPAKSGARCSCSPGCCGD